MSVYFLKIKITICINTYHAALACADDMSKMSQNGQKMVKKWLKCYYHVWIHHEQCIQMSTNMPGIGLAIREIAFEILKMLRTQKTFAW